MSKARLVAVAGGSASGKTQLSQELLLVAERGAVVILSLDNYYLAKKDRVSLCAEQSNFDHPASVDIDLLVRHLVALTQGQSIEAPQYNFARHDREETTNTINPSPIIIIEGILVLWFQSIRELVSYSIFVDAPEGVRLARRLDRDVRERGRSQESVEHQWDSEVQPMFLQYCEVGKQYADEVISGVAWDRAAVKALWGRIATRCGIL